MGIFHIYIYTWLIVVKDAINQQQWEYDSYILVGGLEHDFYFPFRIWDVILPIDELIFFKMVKSPPTSFQLVLIELLQSFFLLIFPDVC